MWLARPFYEALPAALIVIGALALLLALYVERWFWSEILLVTGLLDAVAGLVLVLRRRGYRASRSRLNFDDSQ